MKPQPPGEVPYYADEAVTLYHGDCLDVLTADVLGYDYRLGYAAPAMASNSVDAVVTDPPYGLEFMGKDWDAPWAVGAGIGGHSAGFSEKRYKDGSTARVPNYTGGTNPTCRNCGGLRNGREGKKGQQPCRCDDPKFDNVTLPRMLAFQAWCEEWATECLRVLKPGGHLLAFGGSRTWHRLASAVEDAGFEIRDSIAWLYGSGFPKSLDVSKAIDKTRDDRADVLQVSAYLRDGAAKAGVTASELDAAFGFAGRMAGQWLTDRQWVLLPKWDQWLRLKDLLRLGGDMDAEVWRLNGRKGTPGDNYDGREVLSTKVVADIRNGHGREYGGAMFAGEKTGKIEHQITAPATDDAARWQGWGTALKPAFEPIVVGRKPLTGTVAANVLEHGTGALNIDACRVDGQPRTTHARGNVTGSQANKAAYQPLGEGYESDAPSGRWPTNVVLDESQAAELDKQTGVLTSGANPTRRSSDKFREAYGDFKDQEECTPARGADSGGASRFFPTFHYEAKAPTSERPRHGETAHPTVKPLDLMRWLVRLVTPPGGTVLEPFAGSGTTAEACVIEGFQCIAIEREADYLPLIVNRLSKPIQMGLDFGEEVS